MKKIRWPKMIQKYLIQREMAKKIGGRWQFSAVSPPFLRSSIINIIKETAIPKNGENYIGKLNKKLTFAILCISINYAVLTYVINAIK